MGPARISYAFDTVCFFMWICCLIVDCIVVTVPIGIVNHNDTFYQAYHRYDIQGYLVVLDFIINSVVSGSNKSWVEIFLTPSSNWCHRHSRFSVETPITKVKVRAVGIYMYQVNTNTSFAVSNMFFPSLIPFLYPIRPVTNPSNTFLMDISPLRFGCPGMSNRPWIIYDQ